MTAVKANWRPTPLMVVSLLIILVTVPMIVVGYWRFEAFLVLLVDHVVMAIISMLPRTTALGPNRRRVEDPNAVALSFDDGPDPEVTPAVLALLDEHGARASFFLIGERAASHPELVAEIRSRGHVVENHTWSHSPFFACFPWTMRREIVAAQDQLRSEDDEPGLFRAPAGIRNPLLDRVIHSLGLELCSWTRRAFDTRDGDARRILGRLLKNLRGGDILLLHDGRAARTAQGRAVVLEVLPPLLEAIAERGLGVRPVREVG